MPASSLSSPVQEVLAEAEEKSRKYQWIEAAALYQRALDRLGPASDPFETARVAELLAKCYLKGAFQAESREEFRRVMQLAESAYERTALLYERAGSEALSKKAKARSLFAMFWLRDDPTDKGKIAEKCIALAEEAAQAFDRQGDKRELAETHLDLFNYRQEALHSAHERKLLVDLFESALETGWKAIGEFEELGEDLGLLESMHTMVMLYLWAPNVLEPPSVQELEKKLEKLRRQIAELSQRIGTPYALCLTDEAAGFLASELEADFVRALNLFETGIVRAEVTKDSFIIGRMYTGASSFPRWQAMSEEYVERRRELLEKALRFASSAVKNLEVSSHGAWLKLAYTRYTELYNDLALLVETDPEKKKNRLKQAIEIGRRGMIHENHSLLLVGVAHELSKAMYFLANIHDDPGEKMQLLTEALTMREETVRAHDLLSPSWSRGVTVNYLALLKAELSGTEDEPRKKIELLQDAVFSMQRCVELCTVGATTPPLMQALANYEERYGDITFNLHRLEPETSTYERSIKAYEAAISHLTKSQNPGPIAPIRWKIARSYDTTGDYEKASRSFSQAAVDYRLGVKRAPGLGSVFEELASYMDAWGLIEDSRLRHDEEHYLSAAEDYNKAASLLQATKAWKPLSKHYTACSFLERGEAQSRQERQHAAIESFNAATKAFQEGKVELENRLREDLGSQEKQELKSWLDISDSRARYSLGRVNLEEAKVLDKKGEEEASSEKYRSASQAFKALLTQPENERSRRELETLALVCAAWAKMKEAETGASPELYAEAADSFLKAESLTRKKRVRSLALANASMCRALEVGTRFRRTRDTQLYAEIKKQLETAADYYEDAAVKNAADWTRATQRLFDALIYLADAETEKEPRKKTELFQLAEKHLQLAARLYDEAGYPRKREEALRHLERAREEKELLLMPVEALAENPAVTEVAATPLSLLRDTAVGLERFEAANVVGSLKVSRREINVGEVVTFELEIANVGRATATLIRIENVSAKGLELDKGKIPYPVEDHAINIRGRRLEYLKTHQVKIALKALRKGAFELRPRVVFADEKGSQASYSFEPVSLTAKELGIAGWIKGPGR